MTRVARLGAIAAVRLAENSRGGFEAVFTVPPEIITDRNLPDYEGRWKRWQRGEAAGAAAP